MSKNGNIEQNQHNCPEVVCEQKQDGTRTLGVGRRRGVGVGVGKASSLLLVPLVRKGEIEA